MSDIIQLKTCPFCGGKPDVGRETILGCNILCDNENCIVGVNAWGSTYEKAVEAWNKRV